MWKGLGGRNSILGPSGEDCSGARLSEVPGAYRAGRCPLLLWEMPPAGLPLAKLAKTGKARSSWPDRTGAEPYSPYVVEIGILRTSENPVHPKFGEFLFHALR